MSDLSHLWQRFLLAFSLVAGLAVGVAATVFGYSNLQTVDVHWSVLDLRGVPLWAVVLVPITLILVAGTIYHWLDGLHHFTEHMRHRHRVHELEGELARLRAHLDQVLEMPRDETTPVAVAAVAPAILVPALTEADSAMAGLESDGGGSDGFGDSPESTFDDEPKVKESKDSKDSKDLKDSKARAGRKRAALVIDAKPEGTGSEANGAESEPVTSASAAEA